MTAKTIKITVLIAACLLAPLLHAGRQRFAALDLDTGPRAAAMGSAFTGVAQGAPAVFWNPAGLADTDMLEISLAYNTWLADTSFQYVNGAVPLGFGTLAAEFKLMDFGSYERFDDYGLDLNTQIKASNVSGSIGYGFKPAEFFSAGAAVKFSNLAMPDKNIFGFLFDAGVLFKPLDNLSLGLSVQNIDPAGGDSVFGNFRAGVGFWPIDMENNTILFSADLKYSGGYGISYSVGGEYTLAKMFSARLGYKFREQNSVSGGLSGFSAGAGLTIEKFTFEYAFIPYGDLGTSHIAAVKFTTESRQQAEKQQLQKLTGFLAYQYYRDGQDYFDAGDFKNAAIKWQQVKEMMPEYDGIDAALQKAGRMKTGGKSFRKAEEIFAAGMASYEKSEYQAAMKKWQEVQNLNPDFRDINAWIADAKELAAGGGPSKQARKYFIEGLRAYNNCNYEAALKSWEEGAEKDPSSSVLKMYIEKTRKKQAKIDEGISTARADIKKETTVISGIKKLRDIAVLCPAYKDAGDILDAMKELIKTKTREFYFSGIEKYTEGNLDAAIVYWKNIEDLDPKSEYVIKVRRYIEDARSKQKALEKLKK